VVFLAWARKGASGVKSPNECKNMQDIRTEIDRIDRQVIALLGQRFQYVQAAARFKTSEATVRAPERFQAMLQQRRCWADKEGLAPDAIEKMYSDLVNYFIAEEMRTWKTETQGSPP
jgi:isochorismate pyruvate lyase